MSLQETWMMAVGLLLVAGLAGCVDKQGLGVGDENPVAGQPQQPSPVNIDDSKAVATYANICRVTATRDEVFLDFAVDSHPSGEAEKPIPVNRRIIVNFYTAKRLLAALQMSVARHESVFGVLETDINKRVRPGLAQQQQAAPAAQPAAAPAKKS